MPHPLPTFNLTRIAPTPSGYLHLGNALSFVLTAAVAQQHGAKILLRIDDLDYHRVKDEYVQDIFDTLSFLEIPWDVGPKGFKEYQSEYTQTHRMQLFQTALVQLADSKQVYACQCSRKQLWAQDATGAYQGICRHKNISLGSPHVNWRLFTSSEELLQVKSLKDESNTYRFPKKMQDFVVRKKDGRSAYQLASLVDDIHFGVDLIVRGEDLLESSLAQLFLAECLPKNNFNKAAFLHHPLIKDQMGEKLSKSAGAMAIKTLRENGKTRKDVYRYLGGAMGFPAPIKDLSEFKSLLNIANICT